MLENFAVEIISPDNLIIKTEASYILKISKNLKDSDKQHIIVYFIAIPQPPAFLKFYSMNF